MRDRCTAIARHAYHEDQFLCSTCLFLRPDQINSRRSVSRVLSMPRHWTAIPLGRALRRASRDQPGRRIENLPASSSLDDPPAAPIRSCSRWGLPCRPCCQGRGALLPHRFTLTPGTPAAVCFLWHYPWGRPRRPLAGTVFPWSPDFPPAGLCPPAAVQPSGSCLLDLNRVARQPPPRNTNRAMMTAMVPN